ncbi:MAG: acetate--CoA ligase family protein, partial [bacterium]
PLQGIDTGITALANACHYGTHRRNLLADTTDIGFVPLAVPHNNQSGVVLDEWEGKKRFKKADIPVPDGRLCTSEEASKVASKIGFPVALKAVTQALTHKSEAGAVKIGLNDPEEVMTALGQIQQAIHHFNPDIVASHFLVEAMVQNIVAELLVGIHTDPQFGQIMVIAAGGVWVELMQDQSTLLLPTNGVKVLEALHRLKAFPLLQGFRGQPGCDLDQLVEAILRIASFAATHHECLIEMDVNPLLVTTSGVIAADVMIRLTES